MRVRKKTDTTARIRAVNPELAKLLHKAKGIYELAGGAVDQRSASRATTFDEKRRVLVDRMSHLSGLVDLRDSGSLPFREHVSIKVEVMKEFKALKEGISDLEETHRKDMTKRSGRPSGPEMQARAQAFLQLRAEMEALKAKVSGHPVSVGAGAGAGGGAAGMGVKTLTEEELRSGEFTLGGSGGGGGGGFGAGASAPREELTEEHREVMMMVDRERATQDRLLEQIESKAVEVMEVARAIQDELRYQKDLLEDLDQEIGKSQDKVDRLNKRLDEARKIADDKTSQGCIYLICLIVVLSLATVLFNVVTKFV